MLTHCAGSVASWPSAQALPPLARPGKARGSAVMRPGSRRLCFVLAALCVAAYCCLLLAPLVVYALAYGGAQYTEQLEHSFKAGYSAGFNAAARERLGWR